MSQEEVVHVGCEGETAYKSVSVERECLWSLKQLEDSVVGELLGKSWNTSLISNFNDNKGQLLPFNYNGRMILAKLSRRRRY